MAPSVFFSGRIGHRLTFAIKGTCATTSCRQRRQVLHPPRERRRRSERTNTTPVCHAASQRNNGTGTHSSSTSVAEETRRRQETTEEASRRVLEWNEICRQASNIRRITCLVESCRLGFLFCIDADGCRGTGSTRTASSIMSPGIRTVT